jgi:protocatechuate 3,4-dioxygenase beta subunit
VNGLEKGQYLLKATKRGFGAVSVSNVRVGDDAITPEVEAMLPSAGTLSGSVIDTDGRPLPGVKLSTTNTVDSLEVISDANGQFQFEDLLVGQRIAITAALTGFTSARVVLPVPYTSAQITLRPTGILRGRVVSADSQPVKTFEIEFSRRPQTPLRQNSPGRRSFSSEDGAFVWTDAQPGSWTITARAAGYQPTVRAGITVPESDVSEDAVFVLRPGLAVSGIVIDGDTGQPIANAKITYRDSNTRAAREFEMLESAPITESDIEGRFLLQGLAGGQSTLTVRSSGYADARRDVAVPAMDVVVALSRGGVLFGRVVGDGDVQLARPVRIQLENLETGIAVGLTTASDGQFRFASLDAARYRLTAGDSRSGYSSLDVTVVPNVNNAPIRLVLKRGSVVRGTVRGVSPGELRATQLTASVAGRLVGSAAVSPDGTYELAGLEALPTELRVSTTLGRHLSREVDLRRQPEATEDFEFPELGGRIVGRVSRAGSPVRFATIHATPLRAGVVSGEGESVQDGSYVVDGLEQGEYRVTVGLVGGIMLNRTVGNVSVSGETSLDIDLPNLSVAGRVLDAESGQPLSMAMIQLSSTQSSGFPSGASTSTDGNGDFRIIGLNDQDYQILALKPGYRVLRGPSSVKPDADSILLEMVPTTVTRLRVRDATSRRPLSFVNATIVSGDTRGSRIIPLDTAGFGELHGVANTTFGLTIAWPGYAPTTVDRITGDGSVIDVELVRAGSLRIDVAEGVVGQTATLASRRTRQMPSRPCERSRHHFLLLE